MAENANDDLNSNLLHAPYLTGDPQLDTAIGQWLRWDKVGTWSPRHLSPLPAHLSQSALSGTHPGLCRLQGRWLQLAQG